MPSKKLLILLVAAACALPLTVATASGGNSLLYAMGVPVCKAPAHPHVGTNYCDAMRRVFVKAGTPGARPYVPLRSVLARPVTSGPNATIGPAGGLTPTDLRTAYGLSGTGSGQTVAIVDAYNDPNIQADLTHFSTQYSIPCSSCLTVANLDLPTLNNDTTGWSVEETLDVESVHAICPSCHILLVEAKSTSDTDLGAAENYAASHGAKEITNSFGGPEGVNSTFQGEFNHPGIVITASTGDHGYYDWDKLVHLGTNKPQTPSAFNTVIAVGGTSLFLGTTAARSNETVWNENGPQAYDTALHGAGLGATGGGCSTLFLAQTWQKNVANYAQTACGTKRLDADISAIADPITGFDIYDSYACGGHCDTGWQTEGGTSLASPVVAGIFALAGGAHSVQYPSQTLYSHIGSAFDVTTGGNGFCDGMGPAQCNGLLALGVLNPNLWGAGILDCAWTGSGAVVAAGDRACDAAKGYDGPSGIGSPNGLAMFQP